MVLHRKHGQLAVAQAFDAAVIQIDPRDFETARRRQRLGDHLELVVLGGDGYPTGRQVAHGVVAAVVAVGQAAGRRAGGQTEQLMAQADAHHWRARCDELLELVDNGRQLSRVARPVGKQNAFRLCLENLGGRHVPRVNPRFEAAPLQ